MSHSELLLVVLRVTLESGIIAAYAFWGITTADTLASQSLLGILAPLIGFGLWAVVDFRGAGRHREMLRLAEEMVLSVVASLALYASGEVAASAALMLLSVTYHAAVYATGQSLLAPQRPS